VRLTERSRFIGWEIVCYGRPASGLAFDSGRAHQDFELWLNDVPLVLDHLRLEGAHPALQARYGLAGHTVLGTLFAFPADDALLALVRTVSVEGVLMAITKVDGVLVCRATGTQGDAVRKALTHVWSLARPPLTGREARPPRIWAT
jgi:urease accessory protein